MQSNYFSLLFAAVSAVSTPADISTSDTSPFPIKATTANITEAHDLISNSTTSAENMTLSTDVPGNATNVAKLSLANASSMMKADNTTNVTISAVNGTFVNSTANETSTTSSDAAMKPIKLTS
ncbi:hypothetical protein DSO57_1019186 [Entomophthora muscae]|uniref:Uncharacterized protein n=1 Tax=Entomophthora muscae TaxID=34485 RepID=A0ACC2SH02_9FUNG|nr:hypothetical protein DSO57_1019186 [Entomophthora muscae]